MTRKQFLKTMLRYYDFCKKYPNDDDKCRITFRGDDELGFELECKPSSTDKVFALSVDCTYDDGLLITHYDDHATYYDVSMIKKIEYRVESWDH